MPSDALPSFVAAISGPSGSGKTSLVKAVAAGLQEASTLFFDDWADDPPDLEEWAMEPDADYGRWKTPEFADALAALRTGTAIAVPELSPSVGVDRSLEVGPAPVIVVDEPFGRLRADTAPLLDFVICIDVPLHVALARRLERHTRVFRDWATGAADAAGRQVVLQAYLDSSEQFLSFYLRAGHRGYEHQLRRVAEAADLVVDGMLPVAELASQVIAAVDGRR